MKKIISLVMATTLVLTGCTTKKTVEGEIGGTITVVTDRTDADLLFEKMEADFIKMYPNVDDIIWESSADYTTYITTRMNTKDYGDVLFVPFSMSGTPSEYENYFEPLGMVDELSKDYIDVTEADYNSVAYGLPGAINSLGIVYNEDVMKKAGVTEMPTSMEEMLEACKKIKENTDAIPFYTNYSKSLASWAGTLTAFAGEQYKSDVLAAGTAFQKGQPVRQVMDFFYEVSSNGYTEEDPITGDVAKSKQMLADGKVAMLMLGSQHVKDIQALTTDSSKIEIAPLPAKLNGKSSISFGAPTVVGINKNTSNMATSKAFLDFFVSKASGYAEDLGGISASRADLNEEQKELFEKNNIVLTVPTETAKTEERYNAIANEVGIGRLTDVLQKVINIGLYPNQNETYEEYISQLEKAWATALGNNE